MIDLPCTDALAMVAALPDECATLIHADPPWAYEQSAVHGAAGKEYDGLPDALIAGHLSATARIATTDAYLAVWCTFPKLMEWAGQNVVLAAAGWAYITGGAWGKTNGLGVGFHVRGDSEILLLYKKGSPRPLATISNLWLAHRIGHSEKPQTALRALVSMGAPIGGLVVDLYAGESASMARACTALGRSYIGAELDPARHALALRRLSQREMLLDVA